MVSCCVYDCTTTHTKNPGNYSFHRFPIDPNLRKKWLIAIDRKNWKPQKNTKVCGKHFEKKCFLKAKRGNNLKYDSVPTLFVPMPLTAAEKQKRYRERLKQENPDKYEEIKKKAAAKAKLYYREKESQLTDEEKEKRREQRRVAEREQTSRTDKNIPLTPAEKQKRYRERLKQENPDKYEEYKKKVAAKALLYYREKVSKLTEEEKEKRRQQWRDANRNQTNPAKKQKSLTPAERQKRYREKIKKENPDKHETNKKQMAAMSLLDYRKKVSQLTDEKRDANRNQTNPAKIQMPLTPDKAQEKCREKQQENPDKYEENKKKVADDTRCYREKADQYTEDKNDKSRQQCNTSTLYSAEKKEQPETNEEIIKNMDNTQRNQTTQNIVNKQVKRRLNPAERQRRYREKLKRENPEKYLEIKKKSADSARLYYIEHVSSYRDTYLQNQGNYVRGKALSPRERMRRYRERLKRENPAKYRELLKKAAECAKRYYREKATLYTEEEKEERRQKWREARRINKKTQNKRLKQKQEEIRINEESSSEDDAESDPSEIPITLPWRPNSPSVSGQQDPLRKIDQCRFCGEEFKECLVVSSDMPYLDGNMTTFALNDITVQLDFNNDLPNTVCSNCNAKLQEYCDFIKTVKTAQETMKRRIKTETEDVRDVEVDVVIKTEAPDEDSISISDTVFVKKSYKRKGDVTKQKVKFSKNVMAESEVLVDIKEEPDDEHIECSIVRDVSSETLSAPDELKYTDSSEIDYNLVVKERAGSDTTVNATRVLSPQLVSGIIPLGRRTKTFLYPRPSLNK